MVVNRCVLPWHSLIRINARRCRPTLCDTPTNRGFHVGSFLLVRGQPDPLSRRLKSDPETNDSSQEKLQVQGTDSPASAALKDSRRATAPTQEQAVSIDERNNQSNVATRTNVNSSLNESESAPRRPSSDLDALMLSAQSGPLRKGRNSRRDRDMSNKGEKSSWLSLFSRSTDGLFGRSTSHSARQSDGHRSDSLEGPISAPSLDIAGYSPKHPARLWVDTFPDVIDRIEAENVLHITAVNKNIIEEDFLRTIPDLANHRPFIRVIPMRETATLKKIDSYLIIFRHKKALDEWRANVEHLEKLSSKYTMRSLSHPVVPPQRDFSLKGEKVDQLVKSFALVPAGSRLHSNWDPDHSNRIRQSVRDLGGYDPISAADGRRRNGVLLRITGVHSMELSDILQSIMFDGKQRNMAWDVVIGTKNRFSATVPWIVEHSERGFDDNTSQLDSSGRDPQSVDASEQPAPSENTESHNDMRPSADAMRFHDGHRWIVYFHTQADAQRFARSWHRRQLPLPPHDDSSYQFSEKLHHLMERNGGENTQVYTECLW